MTATASDLETGTSDDGGGCSDDGGGGDGGRGGESYAMAMARATGGNTCGSASSNGDSSAQDVVFRDLLEEDLTQLQELQLQLFPVSSPVRRTRICNKRCHVIWQVRYSDTFYRRLLWHGYFTRVGVTSSGQVVAVASARVVDDYQRDLQARSTA